MLVAQISRQRDFGQAEPTRLAQQSMMQYVSKDSRRFSLGHAWSKTWKTQRGGSFLEPQLAAAISKSDLEVGINVRTPWDLSRWLHPDGMDYGLAGETVSEKIVQNVNLLLHTTACKHKDESVFARFALTDSKPSEERSMYRHLAVLCGPLDSLDFTSTQLAWRLGRRSKIAAGPFAVWRNALR